MTKNSPLEKETHFLFEKHNKKTSFPLEIEEIFFPEDIIKILEKKSKRTKIEMKKLSMFRSQVLCELQNKSFKLWCDFQEEKELKRKNKQQKLAKSNDLKFKDNPTKIKHFGVWFDNNTNTTLSRDSYAIIDKKVTQKPSSTLLKFYEQNSSLREQIYENSECSTYTDLWCEKHKESCLENFDLNLKFFSKIKTEDFEKALSTLLSKRKNIKQIFDLYDCDKMEGIYILVLDKYKQIYIGQSKDIKRRILQHWRKKKEFDKLICGRINSSILSIDVFGCLDTTRIFVLETTNLDYLENRLLNSINKKYILNRTAGGIHGSDTFTMLEILANRNIRKLKKRSL